MTRSVDTQAERVARNQAIFRDANDGISSAADEYGVLDAIPFICECAEPTCTEILWLPVDEYERVRANPTHFVNAPGHHRAAAAHARVLETRDGYDVVEKIGEAGEAAAELHRSS